MSNAQSTVCQQYFFVLLPAPYSIWMEESKVCISSRKSPAGSSLLENEYMLGVKTICLLINTGPRGAAVGSHFTPLSLTVSFPHPLILIPHSFEQLCFLSTVVLFKSVLQIKRRWDCLKCVDLSWRLKHTHSHTYTQSSCFHLEFIITLIKKVFGIHKNLA